MINVSKYVKLDFYTSMLDSVQDAGLLYTSAFWEKEFGGFTGVWTDPIMMMFMGNEL